MTSKFSLSSLLIRALCGHKSSIHIPAQNSLWALVLCCLCFLSAAHAQQPANNPTPTPQPGATPTFTPAPPPTPTPTVAGTPSPASFPSIVPSVPTKILPNTLGPAPILGDPANNADLPPVLIAPTPRPTATPAPEPIITPDPNGTGGVGDITGQNPVEGGVSFEEKTLEMGNGVIYDGERNLALAQGAVTLRFRNFVVRGERGVLDYNTNNATLADNLTVTALVDGRSQTFTGQTIVFNLDTGKWVLSQLKTTFPPDYFPPGTVLAPLYLNDGSVSGQDDNVRGENFRFSSCDRGHYYLRSNRIDFYRLPSGQPQRIVLRKNALFVFGRKILPLPVYSISLIGQRSRRSPVQTTFGQNSYDGFFAKSIYDLRANSKLTDSILVDAYSKRGLGLGLQRQLIGGGLLYLYAVSGKNGGREINSRINKNYRFGGIYAASINFQTTQNNSVTGSGISTRSGVFSMSRAGENAQTNVTYNFDQSTYSGVGSRLDTLNVSHQQVLSLQHFPERPTPLPGATPAPYDPFALSPNQLTLSVTGGLNQSQFGDPATTPANQTGDLNVQLGKTGGLFDMFLKTELHNDFARGNAAFQLERLPELLLQSSTKRLSLDFLDRIAPGNLSFSVGTFNEPTSTYSTAIGGQKNRADFIYNGGQQVQLFGDAQKGTGSSLALTGSFEQAFYSDDTARYNYAYNFNNTTSVGPIQTSINYSKQRTFGFTPFQFDYYTPGEYVDYTASVGRGENFRLNFSGGRDIQNNYTRDVVTSLQWIPSRGTYLSLGTSYGLQDEQRGKFGDIYANLRFARRPTRTLGGQFAVGLRYSPSGISGARGLTLVRGSFDTNITRKIRFQALAEYDGVNNRFSFQQYRAIFDLHCFNLFTTYDGSRNELRIDIALKAFPFADSRFGRNNFSEGFDPSVGEIR